MVYIDGHNHAEKLLLDLGFFAKYPLDESGHERVNDYITIILGRKRDYGETVEKFLKVCENYNPDQLSFGDYLKNYCVGNLYPLYCYYKHQYYNYEIFYESKCWKFLVDFLDNDEIISVLIDCVYNGIGSMSSKIYDKAAKILVINMAVSLAQIFYVWKNLMAKDIVESSVYFLIAMINSRRIDDNLTKSIKTRKSLEDFLKEPEQQIVVVLSKKINDEQMVAVLTMVYNNCVNLYKLFSGKSTEFIKEYCAKNPFFDAIAGKFFMDKKRITANYVVWNICRPQYYILNELVTDELKDAGTGHLDVPVDDMPGELTIEI